MERLKTRDLNQLLQFSQGLLALRSAEDFRQYLLRNLRALISSEFSSYGEIDPSRPAGEMGQTWIEPLGLNPPEYTEWSQKLLAAEPTWLHFQKSRTGSPLTHSDFYSERQYRETEHYALYNEMCGSIRDMIVALRVHSSGLLLNFGAVRGKRYSARDRLMLAAIGPHVFQASLNVKAFSELSTEVHRLYSAIESGGRAAVVVTRDRRVTYSSPRAEAWIAEYFGGFHGDALPERIDTWLRQQLARAMTIDDVAAPADCSESCRPKGDDCHSAGFAAKRLALVDGAGRVRVGYSRASVSSDYQARGRSPRLRGNGQDQSGNRHNPWHQPAHRQETSRAHFSITRRRDADRGRWRRTRSGILHAGPIAPTPYAQFEHVS